MTAAVRPIVKWAGGKTRVLPELLARMPARFGTYYEPFAGGAALFFALSPQRAVLGDINPHLIAMYSAVARDPDHVIGFLGSHAERHSEEWFARVRDNWNSASAANYKPAVRAAAFIYLNRACFNGLWRVNRRGEFNVPWGDRQDPLDGVGALVRSASIALASADLRHGDYQRVISDAQPGDFVYLDPPYCPASRTANFTSYAAGGFGPADQARLAGDIRDLAARGVQVMTSNSDTPLVRELYRGLRIERIEVRRSVGASAGTRVKAGEVIVMAGYEPAAQEAA